MGALEGPHPPEWNGREVVVGRGQLRRGALALDNGRDAVSLFGPRVDGRVLAVHDRAPGEEVAGGRHPRRPSTIFLGRLRGTTSAWTLMPFSTRIREARSSLPSLGKRRLTPSASMIHSPRVSRCQIVLGERLPTRTTASTYRSSATRSVS